MSETPKRRLIDQIGDSPTFVAEGSRLTGDLETPGPLVMCGVISRSPRTTKMFANGSSHTLPSELRRMASSYPSI